MASALIIAAPNNCAHSLHVRGSSGLPSKMFQ